GAGAGIADGRGDDDHDRAVLAPKPAENSGVPADGHDGASGPGSCVYKTAGTGEPGGCAPLNAIRTTNGATGGRGGAGDGAARVPRSAGAVRSRRERAADQHG